MTFDDDFIRLEMDGGTKSICCKGSGIEWPPPETIEVWGFEFKRISYSTITDRQREKMTQVVRAAVYRPC